MFLRTTCYAADAPICFSPKCIVWFLSGVRPPVLLSLAAARLMAPICRSTTRSWRFEIPTHVQGSFAASASRSFAVF